VATKKSPSNDTPTAPVEAPDLADNDGHATALGAAENPASVGSTSARGFPIVGIGASAGGLAAYEAFFSGLPTDHETGMAFVIVQHLSPDHKSILGELMQRYARMPVDEVQDGMRVEPNHIYIIPPNRDMSLENGTLRLDAPAEARGQRLPIDFFFRSLAREHGERAICVILSGTGSDGTLGARAVKGEGGMVMAQEPASTEHEGMPRSVIGTGMVDFVLPPAEMPKQLMAYARHAFSKPPRAKVPAAPDSSMLKRLTSLLKAQTGHDFSQYKSTTLLRRMERRMALHQVQTNEEYFKLARENPAEIEGLFRDLLIGVTNFFRDPEAFKVLEETVIPRLMKTKDLHDQFRVWVCGCSTGEEAYSIAILLQEYIEAAKRSIKVQVFATDIDHVAIEHARAGLFPASISADVSQERLNRFFNHDQERDAYRVQKVIRDMLVFSEQDVIKDPPFSKLDLISCRNLLIYLNSDVQRKLIPLFHYALNPGGTLFLGTSESIGEYGRFFTPVDRKWKIYDREAVEQEPARLGLGEFVPPIRNARDRHRPASGSAGSDFSSNWRQLTEQALLSHYAEAGILVNSRGEIFYIFGRTGQFLEPSSGDASLNVLSMARQGLRREMATALHRAVADKKPAGYRGIKVKSNGDFVSVDLTITPVDMPHGGNSDLYLVILEETPTVEGSPEKAPMEQSESSSRLAELEIELKSKEDYLQTTLEEMETTNEELKSTNEEMQSVNEELQSTNEELETSKEELQSVNEELSTVNAELQDKVADLSRVNNDMNNLLAGTGIGTVFVDNTLRILRFTPAATQVINLIPGDLGRPVDHIVSNLVGYQSFMDDIRSVLDTLQPKEAEVLTKNGAWHLMRIRPYRTIDNMIEGVVLTFVDISERKKAERKLAESETRYLSIFNQALAGLAQTDVNGLFTMVNDRFCEMLGYTREELLKLHMKDITHVEDKPRNGAMLDELVAGGPDFSVEKRYVRRDLGVVWVAERVSAIRDNETVQSLVSITFDKDPAEAKSK
jgi:two-component system CheB/CheR fusion protein